MDQKSGNAESRGRKRRYVMDESSKDDDYSGGIQSEMGKSLSASNKKHTIDSDEEEDELDADQINRQKHDVMNEDDIEGQEEETLEFDGETKITPFNMKGELEEGYFDGSGMYIWNKKDADEIKDSWLDSVDWMKVKQPDAAIKNKPIPKESDSESEDDEERKSAVVNRYKIMRSFMRPKESVLQAVKRLGDGNRPLSASERLKLKKQAAKKESHAENNSSKQASSAGLASSSTNALAEKTPVDRFTELVNQIMYKTGNMDIYSETYESISFKLENKDFEMK